VILKMDKFKGEAANVDEALVNEYKDKVGYNAIWPKGKIPY
jgi:hypothetical protein